MGKAKSCCKKMIKACDCFGTFISFRINDDIEYKSLIGGCSTILFVIVTIGYSLYMAYGYLSRNNVNFIFSNKIIEKDPIVNLTDSRFSLAFGIQYPEASDDAIQDLEGYLDYKMIVTEWIGEDDMNSVELEYERCTVEDFHNLADEQFETNGLEDMLCPTKTQLNNFTLEGLYTDFYFKFIELEIRLTEKGLSEKEIIKQKLIENPIEMAIFFLDSAIDYEERLNPLPVYVNYLYKALDFNYAKMTEVFIASIEFKNDDNLVYDNVKTTIKAMYDYSVDSFTQYEERSSDPEEEEDLLGKFTIKASPKIVQLSRSYQKFPSFLADMTSLLEEILVIMLLVVNFFERKAVDHKLIEKMLKFRGSKYYNVDYLISVFSKDKISSKIIDIIEKQNLHIERRRNVKSEKKSVMILLNNNKGSPTRKEVSVKEKFDSSSINNCEGASEREMICEIRPQKKNETSIERDFVEVDRDQNILDQNIENHSDTLCSKKNSIFYNKNNDSFDRGDLSNSIEGPQDVKNEIEDEKNYKRMSLCEIVCSELCFWTSRKQKKRHDIIANAEKKIHYYLDIYTYIQKMQEIDILKYCLFDEDQLELFDFLSKPPVKMSTGSLGIYSEFQNHQTNKRRLGKIEIDCLFQCYKNISQKKEITFEDIKLLRLVKAEVDFLGA